MAPQSPETPVLRFAPSPNGRLHLGHALSACLNSDFAKAWRGRFLLRIEDIDLTRCTPEFETSIYEDLGWLGLQWEKPVRRQSDHFEAYRQALDRLRVLGVVYPSFMSRRETRAFVAKAEASGWPWPRDPDGVPHFPPLDREIPQSESAARVAARVKHAWRLDMEKALALLADRLTFEETGDDEKGTITADPSVWGDVVLSRSDALSSYHLSVVVDDALQGITHVVRGLDLFAATSIHRLLQELLKLPVPVYHHHRLLLDPDGRKLSKSAGDIGLAELRAAGAMPADIRRMVGL